MTSPYDLVILGSGTSAFAGALKASDLGARVAIVEQSQLGGTCVNWGCIPSKTLIHQAKWHWETALRSEETSGRSVDCGSLMAEKRRAVETVREESYQRVLQAHPQIEIFKGHGTFISPQKLQVGERVLFSERFLIACGGFPRVLPLPGVEKVNCLTSYSALNLSCFPNSLLIVGGGVIALEMGQMFARFGTKVTVVERSVRILKDFDSRLTSIYQRLVEEEGMTLHFEVNSRRVYQDGGGVCLQAEVGGKEREFRAERLLMAVGTAPATENIGLEKAGVETDPAGFIRVDGQMRTSAPQIWAAGDCTGPPLIAPAGAREAEVAVENMFDVQARRRIDHSCTPMAVFTDPEFAMVGRTMTPEYDALETFIDLRQVPKAHVMGGREGGIVLSADRRTGTLLGVQLLAPRAADIIHSAALAVRLGVTVQELAETVHVYPTISDGLRLAAVENLKHRRSESAPPSPWHPGHP